MHPAAPDDRTGLIDAFDHSVQSIIDLGYSCRDEDFEIQTECPGWTVRTRSRTSSAPRSPSPACLDRGSRCPTTPTSAATSRASSRSTREARRGVTGRDIVAELAEFHPRRVADLRASDADVDTVIGGFFGPTRPSASTCTAGSSTRWVHEQDIRAALDRPGNLDSASAAIFTADILEALPRIASRVADIGAGHAVVLDVSGPVVARGGARIVTGEDGRPYGEALFSGNDRPQGEEQLDVTSIHLTTDALTRRAARHRSSTRSTTP